MHIHRDDTERRDSMKRHSAQRIKRHWLTDSAVPPVLDALVVPASTARAYHPNMNKGIVNWPLIVEASRDFGLLEERSEKLRDRKQVCFLTALFFSKLPPGAQEEIQQYPVSSVLSLQALFGRPTVVFQLLREGGSGPGIADAYRRWKKDNPLPKAVAFAQNQLGAPWARLFMQIVEWVAGWQMMGAAKLLDPDPPNKTEFWRRGRRQAMFIALDQGIEPDEIAASLGCTASDVFEAYKKTLDDPQSCEAVARVVEQLGTRMEINEADNGGAYRFKAEHAKRIGSYGRMSRGRHAARILRSAAERVERQKEREFERRVADRDRARRMRSLRFASLARQEWAQEMDRGSWDTHTPSFEDHCIERIDAQRAIWGLNPYERNAVVEFMVGASDGGELFEHAMDAVRGLVEAGEQPVRRTADHRPVQSTGSHWHTYKALAERSVTDEGVEVLYDTCSCGKTRYRYRHQGGTWIEPRYGRAFRTAEARRRVRAILCDLQRGRCALCGETMEPADMTIDHIVPSDLGGSDDFDNLQLAHSWCNEEKGNSIESIAS